MDSRCMFMWCFTLLWNSETSLIGIQLSSFSRYSQTERSSASLARACRVQRYILPPMQVHPLLTQLLSARRPDNDPFRISNYPQLINLSIPCSQYTHLTYRNSRERRNPVSAL
ncbi:hypothetical protein JAAARDRAFT_408536 [Jaapia argillacea MUCL 33604]|uniref:Secreted protein n=1 Tax=Jaapia argillacea MUCL 33604 TaxID=933084 RepID=A0A067PUK4_9AGAM|nr:hypothetical protein JAAARDRAFT_408536 [Jaapia argillacea MUCL 33604]